MIWVKRILPFIIIAALYFAYDYYQTNRRAEYKDKEDTYSEVIAHLWVASVTYRDSAELYQAYRESLLTARNLDSASIFELVSLYEKTPEAISSMVGKIKIKTDSLIKLLDSIKSDTTVLTEVDSTSLPK